LAGVSIATVSHVGNDTGAVGDATRQRIRLLVKSVGYEPNIHAQKLAGERGRKAKLHISTLSV
jgi:LacI family transcriptional regulator